MYPASGLNNKSIISIITNNDAVKGKESVTERFDDITPMLIIFQTQHHTLRFIPQQTPTTASFSKTARKGRLLQQL